MRINTSRIELNSCEKTDFIDVTDPINDAVEKSGIKNGIANLFTRHTTTAIRINENEQGLLKDTKEFLECYAPRFRSYCHDDMEKRPDVPVDEPANAHSHLKSLVMGASESIPLINGHIALGRWQRIFFVDLDGPRSRQMIIHIIGE